jgi:hypothetical protein
MQGVDDLNRTNSVSSSLVNAAGSDTAFRSPRAWRSEARLYILAVANYSLTRVRVLL